MKDTVTAQLELIEARCEREAPAGETALELLRQSIATSEYRCRCGRDRFTTRFAPRHCGS
jgi:hypothetical protein